MNYFAIFLAFLAVCVAFFAGVEDRVRRSMGMVVAAGVIAQIALRLYGA